MHKYLLLLFMCILASTASAQTYKENFEKAIQSEKQDSLQQAVEFYKKALKLEPANAHNSMIFANLARVQRRMYKFEEALDSYNCAINMLPLSVPILIDRATLCLEMGMTDKSYVDCCLVLDIDKRNIQALLFRAYLSYCKRQYGESLADYRRLLEIEPTNIPAKIGIVTVYQQEKKFKEALEQINILVSSNPNDYELYIIRSGIEKDMNYIDLSLSDLDKAIALSPKNANTYLLRGDILLTLKKKQQAKLDFEKAIELGMSRGELVEKLRECR